MQDCLQAIFFRKHFVMLLNFFLVIVKLAFFVRSQGTRQLPVLVLEMLFTLKVASVSFNELWQIFTKHERVKSTFWPFLQKQISHLVQNTETDVIVRLNLHVSLLNGATKCLKVHAHLSDFNLYWCEHKGVIIGVCLFCVEKSLQDFGLMAQ